MPEVLGFKAVWVRPSGCRYEWYPHINRLFFIQPMIGSRPISIYALETLMTLGKPEWH